jgi:tetratricopeptide (TPR) repeat protein
MSNLEYIEDYFKGTPTPDETTSFEERIQNDPSFAEEVAFYLSGQHAAAEMANDERRVRFRELNFNHRSAQPAKVVSMRRVVIYAAACLFLAAVVMSWLFFQPVSTEKLANQYIDSQLTTLSVSMGTQDNMQEGLDQYNAGKLEESLKTFESIYKNDNTKDLAERYAGIAALRLQQFDKAISYFEDLSTKNLYSNPGKFYVALTLMKRNQAPDKERAHMFLKEVVDQNLEGKEIAEQWLKKM